MPSFRAVAFDLFDTLVDFDPSLFPVVVIDGKQERTTSRLAYDALYDAGHSLPAYPAFNLLWMEVSKEVWGERNADPSHREISSSDRFGRLMERLVSIPSREREAAARVAMSAHMEGLIASTVFDKSRLEVLERIRTAGMPVGLVSNFDNAAAARGLLERSGIASRLDTVHISEEEGFRKPAPSLFLNAAEGLGVEPGDVLFVGDTFEADVVGPQGVGMSAAWLNPKREPVPEGGVSPEYIIGTLEEVLEVLGLKNG